MKIKLLILFWAMFIWMISPVFSQDGFQYYYQAKKLMHQREYGKALELLNKLKKEFPDSKYKDDAEFWSAYILEKQKRYDESFRKYAELKKKYPKSPWVDDAEVQQIGIAEKLANQGKHQYLNFLVERANSKDKTIKYQASMSLGKLNDQRALPGLRQIASNGDKDMSQMARTLIKKIENKENKISGRKEIKNKFPFGDKRQNRPVPRLPKTISKPKKQPTISHPPKRGSSGSSTKGQKNSGKKGKSF